MFWSNASVKPIQPSIKSFPAAVICSSKRLTNYKFTTFQNTRLKQSRHLASRIIFPHAGTLRQTEKACHTETTVSQSSMDLVFNSICYSSLIALNRRKIEFGDACFSLESIYTLREAKPNTQTGFRKLYVWPQSVFLTR